MAGVGRGGGRVEFAQGGRGLSLRPADRALDRIQVKNSFPRSQLTDDDKEVQTTNDTRGGYELFQQHLVTANTICLLHTLSAHGEAVQAKKKKG